MSDFGLLRPPASVLVGPGTLSQLGRQAAALGSRVLVCTDPNLARGAGFASAATSLREQGLKVTILDAAVPELPRADVEAAIAAARPARPEVIVGFGGGSSIDLAKLIALALTWEGMLDDWYGEEAVPGPCLPVIAVPTTAGTGSEVTPVAVLSDPDHELKVGISSVRLIPRAAICDSLVTHGAPASVTANAGIDALAHAIEAYTARRRPAEELGGRVFVGKNTLSDVFARRAVSLLASALEPATRDDPAGREMAMEGSLCAGLAFAGAGTALAHALQYPVGARTKTAHGAGIGLLLPHVMRFNAPARSAELAELAVAIGVGDTAQEAIDRVATLVAELGLPGSLAEMNVSRAELPMLADQALGIERLVANNPRPVDLDGALEVLEAAWAGGRPTPLVGSSAGV